MNCLTRVCFNYLPLMWAGAKIDQASLLTFKGCKTIKPAVVFLLRDPL